MKVPYLDLRAQYDVIKPEIDAAFADVFQKMQFIGGEEVELFEKEFAAFLHAKHVISVNSGTDALILGIEALKLPPGSEVIVPANTFYATAVAVIKNNLKLVFVDVTDDYGISLTDLKQKITPKTKAIIAVHLYGQPDTMDEIKRVIAGSKQDIFLIEDACQAHGATYKDQTVGSFGVFAAFSFYPGKNLGAYGDGGAIVTNDDALEKKFKLLREYGQTEKYHHETIGINSRLDSIQAAILRKKLVHVSVWNEQRGKHARYYNTLLLDCKQVITPKIFDDRKSVFHIYALRVEHRDLLQKYLSENGITTLIHYPVPLHETGAFSFLNYKKGDFPVAEQHAEDLLSLPMYPELSNSQIEYVVDKIKTFYINQKPS